MYDVESKISGIENKISDLENVLPCYDIPSAEMGLHMITTVFLLIKIKI